ncbi:MAG: transglutaminase domain-containing protein [Chloroflexi bacterium]|nr:transglutaminase domain-containing protein [Chloroflexota bacterium]
MGNIGLKTAIHRRWLRPAEGWLTFVFLTFIQLAVVFSVEQAEWVKPMPSLWPTALIALGAGLALAKARVPASLLHAISLVLGFEVVARVTASLVQGPTLADQRLELWDRMSVWGEVVRTGGISSDTIPFVLMLASLTWVISYIGAWSVFRWRQAWGALIPSGFAILVNLSYLPEHFAYFFALFLFSAMLLVMRLNFVRQERRWKDARVGRAISWRFLLGTVCLSLVTLVLSWQLPLASAHPKLASVWERSNTPWEKMESQFNRLFASLSSSNAIPIHNFTDIMPLRGPISLGNQMVLKVKSDAAGYWRANTYDIYTGLGWVSGMRMSQPLVEQPSEPESPKYLKRKEITQSVELNIPTELIFAAGEPLRVDVPVRSQLTMTPPLVINLDDPSQDSDPNPLIRSTAGVLRAATRRGRVSTDDIMRYLPPGMRVLSVNRRGPRISSVEIVPEEPENHDIASLQTLEKLGRYQKYSAVSSVSAATDTELRKAGQEYPSWVVNRFLQLPPLLPARVRRLAEQITTDADNPYDKSKAIETYLRGLGYSLEIPPPPFDSDAVDNFLFTIKEGYCDYFASAMAVMLRSVGIPARVVAGYNTGDYDVESGTYLVRESNAHSWPEVFFPKYGWVEWEPTPAWPVFERADASLSDEGLSMLAGGEDSDEPLDDDLLYMDDDEGMLHSLNFQPDLWELARWPLAFLTLAAMLGLASSWLVLRRGLGHLGYAAQTYERMCRLAYFAGLKHRTHETPYEYARRLNSYLPGDNTSISDIVEGYVRSHYGAKTLTSEEHASLKAAWAASRNKLLRCILWRRN